MMSEYPSPTKRPADDRPADLDPERGTADPSGTAPRLVSVRMIWGRAGHSAFTDLARFRGRWFCVFREAPDHMNGAGRIRLLDSADGTTFRSVRSFSQPDIDLRDPKLSLAPDGRLMLLAGGTKLEAGHPVGRRPRVAFSADGVNWSRLRPILEEGDWLWRVSWHRRRAYGISYRLRSARIWTVTLLESKDGVTYRELCDLKVPGRPNEATVRFAGDDSAVVLIRREGGDKRGWVGWSRPPYTDWQWEPLSLRLGGPNFLVLPGGEMWAATRVIRRHDARTAVGRLTRDSFTPQIELPSGGDCSYPGMVWFRRQLWISYYSSHEGTARIYLARLRLT